MKALALLAILLGLGAAQAADMPIKAPNLIAYPAYNGSGVYWGIGTEAGVEQTKTSGNPLFVNSLINGSLTAAGGAVGGTVGYMKGSATSWWAVEASANYNNITSSTAGASFSSRWNAEQIVKFGGFQKILAMLPDLGISFPALPDIPAPPGFNIAANTSHPYVMAGIREFGMQSAVGVAHGTTIGIAPMVGMGVLNQLLDKNGKLNGYVIDTGAKVVFANKGKTIDFINNGAPTFGGKIDAGTQYFVYLKILG